MHTDVPQLLKEIAGNLQYVRKAFAGVRDYKTIPEMANFFREQVARHYETLAVNIVHLGATLRAFDPGIVIDAPQEDHGEKPAHKDAS